MWFPGRAAGKFIASCDRARSSNPRATTTPPRGDSSPPSSTHSTGVYGYPVKLAAAVAVSTIRASAPAFPAIREVVFCCFSQGDLLVYEQLLLGYTP